MSSIHTVRYTVRDDRWPFVRAVTETFGSRDAAERRALDLLSTDASSSVAVAPAPPDTTYCLRDGEHYALVGGRVHGPWPDKGAAAAGLAVEQRRLAARLRAAAAEVPHG